MTDVTLPNAPAPSSNDKTAIWIGYVLGALALPGCFIIAARMGGETWLNILICIFGSIVGWTVGMLISPFPVEKRQFTELLENT